MFLSNACKYYKLFKVTGSLHFEERKKCYDVHVLRFRYIIRSCLFTGVHWLLMTAWITFQNADFGDTACEKRIFNAVSGFVYIFCFLNLKDGPTRGRLTIYYIITLVENTILVILWFLFKPDTSPDWMNIATPTVIYGGFVVGA